MRPFDLSAPRRLAAAGRSLVLLAVAAAIAVPAIAWAQKVKVKAAIVAAEDVNPNVQGRPSPVRLILYQLAAADAFNDADFMAVYDPESDVLGDDLLKRTPHMIQPGQTLEFEEEFEEGTQFLGVIAGFRDIENAEWRTVVGLEASRFFSLRRSNKLTIAISALSVEVIVE